MIVVLGLMLMLAVSTLIHLRQPATVNIAQGMLGESWYRIALGDQHVGHMHNRAHRDHLGAWHFQTTTHFVLQDQTPNTISKLLVFDPAPPFALRRALYTNRAAGQLQQTEVEHGTTGYIAHLMREAQRNSVDLDWQFTLDDFLGFERWLLLEQPMPDAQYSVSNPDFERLRLRRQSYRVVEHNEIGYLVENNAPLAATQTQLNQHFRPMWLNMAGIFQVSRATEGDALALQKFSNKTNYLFALNQRLDRHTDIQSLALQVRVDPRFTLPARFETRAGLTSGGRPGDLTGETLRYPVTDERIQQLTQRALSRGDEPLRQLVNTAYEQLGYRENRPAGSVLKALENGYGECTDFADLLTTMARAAGYPAQTVYGLAYQDGATPAFMFHAWNEVYIGGRWHAVDPTWNQTRTDATHIPLDDTLAARMLLANNVAGVKFEIEEVQYASMGSP